MKKSRRFGGLLIGMALCSVRASAGKPRDGNDDLEESRNASGSQQRSLEIVHERLLVRDCK